MKKLASILLIMSAPIGIMYIIEGMYSLFYILTHLQDSSFEDVWKESVWSIPRPHSIIIYLILLILFSTLFFIFYRKKKNGFF